MGWGGRGGGRGRGLGVGVTARREGLGKWGSRVEGSSISKNRPSHHKFKSPKQFERKQS